MRRRIVLSLGQVWSGFRLAKGSVSVRRLADGLAAREARSPACTWLGWTSLLLGCVQRSFLLSSHVTAWGESAVCITTLVLPLGTFSISAHTA